MSAVLGTVFQDAESPTVAKIGIKIGSLRGKCFRVDAGRKRYPSGRGP